MDYRFQYYRSDRDISDWFRVIIFLIIAGVVIFLPIDCSVGYFQGKWNPAFGKVVDKRSELSHQRDNNGYDHSHYDYYIDVDVRGYINQIEISHSQFNNIRVGDQVQVVMRVGGLTGCAYGYGFKNKVTGLPAER